MQKIEFSYGRDLTKKLRYKNRGYRHKNGRRKPPEKREKLLVFVRLNFGPVFIGFLFGIQKLKVDELHFADSGEGY